MILIVRKKKYFSFYAHFMFIFMFIFIFEPSFFVFNAREKIVAASHSLLSSERKWSLIFLLLPPLR